MKILFYFAAAILAITSELASAERVTSQLSLMNPAPSQSTIKGLRVGVIGGKHAIPARLVSELKRLGVHLQPLRNENQLAQVQMVMLDGKALTRRVLENPILRAAWDRSIPIALSEVDEAKKHLLVEYGWLDIVPKDTSTLWAVWQSGGEIFESDLSGSDWAAYRKHRRMAEAAIEAVMADAVIMEPESQLVRASSTPRPEVGPGAWRTRPHNIAYHQLRWVRYRYDGGIPGDGVEEGKPLLWDQQARLDFGVTLTGYRTPGSENAWVVGQFYVNANPDTKKRGHYMGNWGLNRILTGGMLLRSTHVATVSEGLTGWQYSPTNSNGSSQVTTGLSVNFAAPEAAGVNYSSSITRDITDWEVIANQNGSTYSWDYRSQNGSFSDAEACYQSDAHFTTCGFTDWHVNRYNTDSMPSNMSAIWRTSRDNRLISIRLSSTMYTTSVFNQWMVGQPNQTAFWPMGHSSATRHFTLYLQALWHRSCEAPHCFVTQ